MWGHLTRLVVVAAVVWAIVGTQMTKGGAAQSFVNLSKVSEDYKVGAGDLLDIQVIGNLDLSLSVRISNSGEISYPMLGQLQVSDLSAFEIENKMARLLREKGLLENAEVLVFIREYHAKPVYVTGAVVNPGEFIMSQALTVSDVILLAGGLHFNAADEALIHRRTAETAAAAPERTDGTPGPGTQTVHVDITPLKAGRFLQDGTPLQQGDVVFVPELRLNAFYVVGEVLEPRNFTYRPGRVITASQAISWAGGPTPTAKMSDGFVVRIAKDGKRQEIPSDYEAILTGKRPDFPIEPNDIIFVPGSRIKTITYGLVDLTDDMVSGQLFRIGRRMRLPEQPEIERMAR